MRTINHKTIFIIFVITALFFLSVTLVFLLRPHQQTPLTKLVNINGGTEKFKNAQTLAAWIWKSPTQIKPDLDSMITFAKKEDINTFYVYIDEYIDIYEMPNGPKKDSEMSRYMTDLKDVVIKATNNGIVVNALSGDTAYSYDSNSYIPPILIKHIFDFNKQNPQAKIQGIQFDIEFYEDPRFWGSPKEYTIEYINLVSDTAKLTNELNSTYKDNVRLGYVIPFWFDEPNQYTPEPILNVIISALSKTKNPYLIIMAYRNVVGGKGGSLDVSEKELQGANDTPVKIIIGQELTQNKETKITLFGKSKKEIKDNINQIIDGAKTNSSFEGISIHDLDAFMKVN